MIRQAARDIGWELLLLLDLHMVYRIPVNILLDILIASEAASFGTEALGLLTAREARLKEKGYNKAEIRDDLRELRSMARYLVKLNNLDAFMQQPTKEAGAGGTEEADTNVTEEANTEATQEAEDAATVGTNTGATEEADTRMTEGAEAGVAKKADIEATEDEKTGATETGEGTGTTTSKHHAAS